VHNVSQWPNLRNLGELLLGGAEGLLEAVSFKKATKGMGRGRVVNARWEWVPDCYTSMKTHTASSTQFVVLSQCLQEDTHKV